jgi:hypothetical protein
MITALTGLTMCFICHDQKTWRLIPNFLIQTQELMALNQVTLHPVVSIG